MKFSSVAVTAFLAANFSTTSVERKHGMRHGNVWAEPSHRNNQAAVFFEPHGTIGGKKDGDTSDKSEKKSKKKDKEPTCSPISAYLRTSTETSTCFDVKSRQELAFVITQAIDEGRPSIQLCPVEIDMSDGVEEGIVIDAGAITIGCAKQDDSDQCVLKGPGADAMDPSRFFFVKAGAKLELEDIKLVDSKAPADLEVPAPGGTGTVFAAVGGAVRNEIVFKAKRCRRRRWSHF